ncbi:MAG: radical SAM protein [Methanotrichaceae archaeon]|nr:radical SAM protein [Methanotrichaceae archaeon]
MPPNAIDRSVMSICPICLKPISGRIFQECDRIFIEKTCDIHGHFNELYWSDAEVFRKFNRFLCDGTGIDNSKISIAGCPFDCGLCSNHKTATLLGNIDITNKCNMDCSVCFANAGGQVYEPTLNQIKAMMQNLRSQKPIPCPAVQFSGGEPTIRDDLPQIVAMAEKMGFSQIQIATNGLRLAASPNFCHSLVINGLNTVYLQFDGVTAEPYKIIRGRDFFPAKLKALNNLKRAGQKSVVLVPTLAKGVNDHQVGDMVKFASKRLDIVKGINMQPVSFSGRIDSDERAHKRLTIPDLFRLLEEQTDNQITRDDFYPVSFVAPISRLIAAESGKEQPIFTVHPCCGAATYIYNFDSHLIPITRFIDVEGLFEKIRLEVDAFNGSNLGKLKMRGKILKQMPRFLDENRIPGDLNVKKMLVGIFMNGTRESLKEFHNKTLFLGAMHFQDVYNMDLERLQRCGVHYATPDGRIIPFCSYNTIHRKEIEDKFSLKTPLLQ